MTGLTRRRFLGSVAGTVVAGGLVEACAPSTLGAATAAAQAVPKTLSVAHWDENKSYDGFANFRYYLLKHGIGDPLVRVGFDRQFEAMLATRLEPLDSTTWQFSLRTGVTFHNGAPLDARAVKEGLERAVTGVKGTPGALAGLTVEVDGPTAGRIRTKAPVPYLRALLSSMPILERSSFEADGTIVRPIGTGPFKHVDYRPSDRRVFEAHERCWRGAPKVRDVQWRFVTSSQTRAHLLRAGEVDVATTLSPSEVKTLRSVTGVRLLTLPQPRIRALYPNTQRGPTSDVRVRKAIAHAIDRAAIVSSALEDEGTVQETLFPPDYPWGSPGLKAPPLDRERAKQLLADAGYGPSKKLSLTLLTYPDRAELALIAQVLQRQLAAVGIDVKISVQAYTVVETTVLKERSHDLLILVRNPVATYDPQVVLEMDFTANGSYNLSGYSAIESKIARAAGTSDPNGRWELVRQIEQQVIADDVAMIVLSAYILVDGVRENVTGWRLHPTDLDALTEAIDKR